MRLSIAIVAILISYPALATEIKSIKTLPFDYSVAAVKDVTQDGATYTVVTIKLKNGPSYLNEAVFRCDARNAAGQTWNIDGRAVNVDRSTSRTFNLTSQADTFDVAKNANKVTCRVSSFTSIPPID